MLLFGKRKKKKIEDLPVWDKGMSKELNFPSLVDYAINEGIHFEKDHFIIQTGLGTVKYGRTIFIKPSGYPRTVRIGWLDSLFNSDDVDVSIHIQPFNRSIAIKKLKEKIDKLEAVYYSAIKNENFSRAEEAEQKINDSKILQTQIRNNQNGLYYVAVQASVYADTLEELNAKCVHIETLLGGESIEVINAFGRQKEAWLSTLPLGRNCLDNSERNLDQLALTAIFPHSSSKLNHTGGIPIGVYGREYVYFNQFDPKLNNFNKGIFGESGAGKSVYVKQLIGRGFSDGISRVCIIDVEPEYTELTRVLGGIVIELRSDITENISSRINPLDVYVEREIFNKNTKNEYFVERININEKIKEVIEFFKVMKETTTGNESANLTPIELGVLNDVLEELYKERGITEDPESIYEQIERVDENGNIEYGRKYIEMPTISDVYNKLIEKSKEYPGELEEMINIVQLFTKGKAFGMFDGQTKIVSDNPDVDLDNAPIVTFDISKLSEKGIERPLAQHVLMTWIWNRFIKNDPKTKKRVVQDEAWMSLQYNTMIEFFKLLSARGRKWNTSLTLVSQRYSMFERNPAAQDVIAQLASVAFLKQSDQDIEPILRTFRFSPEVGERIRTSDVGDVLLKAGKEIVYFRSMPTKDEWVYLNTNQNISADELANRY